MEAPSIKISTPEEFQYCIFEKAPNLPLLYKENIEYWGGYEIEIPVVDTGCIFYQDSTGKHEYFIEMDEYEGTITDKLISSGIVVKIENALDTAKANSSSFFKISVKVPFHLFDDDISEASRIAHRIEIFYLYAMDIINSPTPNEIYIDLLRYELLDYGWYY
jgi:hypothetical protein